MNKLVAIFKLSRPFNALLVVFALWITRIVIGSLITSAGLQLHIAVYDFWVVCLIGTFILAAGNVINDIVDKDIDVINKPHKALIPKVVSERFAWLVYWALNLFAFVLSLWLGWKYGLAGYLIVPILAIILLYIYSYYLKKTAFYGNMVIALLCAGMPFVYFVLEYDVIVQLKAQSPAIFQELELKGWSMIIFSFMLVLAREIIKDCEDVEGDEAAGARTLPLAMGTKNAFTLATVILLLYLCVFIFLGLWRYTLTHREVLLWAVGVYVVLVLGSFYFARRGREGQKLYKRLSSLIKLYLIFGLIFILY